MLRINLFINHTNIGHIAVHNTDERRLDEDADEVQIRYDVYDLRGHPQRGDSFEDYPHLGHVWHDQDGDAATLTAQVMAEVVDGEADLLPADAVPGP